MSIHIHIPPVNFYLHPNRPFIWFGFLHIPTLHYCLTDTKKRELGQKKAITRKIEFLTRENRVITLQILFLWKEIVPVRI